MYASAGGVRLWYERRGSGSPVVLLHGLGESHDLWRHQIEPLSSRYDVITLDLHGHGGSGLPSPHLTLSDMADDVATMLEQLSLTSPIVVGLSMGGGAAQTIAVRYPALPRALVLVSTSSEFPASTRRRMTRRALRAERAGMAAVVDETVPRWFTAEFARRRPDEVERTRRTVLDTSPAGFAAVSRANAARNLTADLGGIRCPVLFVGGDADPAVPRRALAIYQERIPQLAAEIVPRASHLVPVEAPETFNAVLLRFLERVEATVPTIEGGERT